MQKTRIVFCVNTLGNGGAERVMANLANYFAQDKRLKIYLLCEYSGEYTTLISKDVEILDISPETRREIIGLRFINSICRVAGQLKKSCPDIVVSALPGTCIKVTVAKLFCKLNFRYIHRETNIVFRSQFRDYVFSLKKEVIRKLYAFSYKIADTVIANSDDTKFSIMECYHVPGNKIITLPNPVICSSIIDQYKQSDIADPEFPRKKFILSVGRLVEQKGYDVLIKAYSEIAKHFKDIDLVILGSGPLKDDLLLLCKTLGCEKSVHILDFRKNVYDYYLHCELFVLSSRFEGFGNVVVEALAFGKPAIVTDCKGGPHIIVDEGKNGIIVPMDDIDSLKNSMENILSGKIEFDPKRQKERARYFSIENVAEMYKKVILNKYD